MTRLEGSSPSSFRDEGYEVACAENGVAALCEIRTEHLPDLVPLDLMMPVMNGWEVLLQESEHLSRIPVLVVSAMNAPGAREHLAKPIDVALLVSTVGRLTS